MPLFLLSTKVFGTNILWLIVNGHRYAIAYNHHTEEIEIRDRNQNGTVIDTFNNQTSAATVKQIFARL